MNWLSGQTMKKFKVKGKVKKFTGNMAWHYINVPQTYDDLNLKVQPKIWGFVRITATVGKTTWETSLLPMGNGSLFIALKAAVRKKEDILEDDTITITYSIK